MEKTKEIRTKQIIGIFVLIAAVAIPFFLYWASKKEVWFCDEIYTYESANGFEQEWPAAYVDTWMTGKDVEAFFAADGDSLSLESISVRLYNDHVPLYFWIFRMVSFYFFHGSGSIWIGLSINLVFYLGVLLIIYYILLKAVEAPIAAGVITVLLGVCNRLMLEQATMLRMYMMLLWVQLMLLLTGFRILRDTSKGRLSAGAFISLFGLTLFGLLTHFDFWIYYAITATLFCLWLLILAWRKERLKLFLTMEGRAVLAWGGSFGAALFATVKLFPYCLWNLNRGKGEMALGSLFVFSREKIQQILWGFSRLSISFFGEKVPVWMGLLLMFGCILGGGIVLYRRREWFKLTGLTLAVLIAQAYQLIVCFTLPDAKEERYLWGTFTIMDLCMFCGAYLLIQVATARMKEERTRRISRCVILPIFCVALLLGQLAVIDGGHGVAYLFHSYKDVKALEEHSQVPWVVYGPTVGVYSYYDWLLPEEICFLTVDKTAEDAAAIRELNGEESFLLYVYEEYLADALDFTEQILGHRVACKYVTRSTNLTVHLIEVGK